MPPPKSATRTLRNAAGLSRKARKCRDRCTRPVRSTTSFVPSDQVSWSVHGARVTWTVFTRGSASIACSSIEFVPFCHQVVAVGGDPRQGLAAKAWWYGSGEHDCVSNARQKGRTEQVIGGL